MEIKKEMMVERTGTCPYYNTCETVEYASRARGEGVPERCFNQCRSCLLYWKKMRIRESIREDRRLEALFKVGPCPFIEDCERCKAEPEKRAERCLPMGGPARCLTYWKKKPRETSNK